MGKKIIAWAIKTKRKDGYPLTIGKQLPIYWFKKQATMAQKMWGGEVAKIEIKILSK